MDNKAPDSNLQLELLALLVFFDVEAKHIRGAVDIELFDSRPIQNLVREAYAFIDTYGAAPKAHFGEMLAKYMEGADKEMYQQVSARVLRLKDGINSKYVMSRLQDFLDTQNIQLTVLKVLDALERKDTEAARQLFHAGSRRSAELADRGVFMSEAEPYLYAPDTRMEFSAGIKELDERRFAPARGELMMGLGLSGRMKSWWLIHIGATNVKKGFKVLHISLEMRMKQCLTRYAQNLMFITKDFQKNLRLMKLDKGHGHYIVTSDTRLVHGLKGAPVKAGIGGKLKTINNLLVKTYPEGTLSLSKLNAYLDMLEVSCDFMPDLVLVDYPDLFHLDKREEKRIALGNTYTGLRQMAEERNLGVVVVSQSNRSGVNKAILTEAETAEDFSKYAASDSVASFNMTDEEKRLGLSRLYVLKNRDDIDRYCVVVNHAIEAGQFAVSAVDYDEAAYSQLITEQSAGLDIEIPQPSGEEFQ